MRAWKNNKLVLLFALPLWLLAAPVRAEFGLTMVQSEIQDDIVHFTAVIDTGLTQQVEEAISRGIPIEVIVDVELEQYRRILWNAEIKTWELRRRLQFHALSQQYVVQGFGAATRGFYSLDAALKYLGALREIALILPEELDAGTEHRVRLRARLDIESLPAPLRPVAYASAAWRLSSGWKEWKVGK